MTFRARRLSWMLWAGIAVSGCECGIPIGEELRDAGRDAGSFRPRTDECGNGIDDDRNGRIDDGCVCGTGDTQSCFSGDYPGHGIGACRDGVQTCAVQEFGDWGMFTCVGETLPSAELCDGIDNDCDGATDEDCPCPFGATRMCSDEFATAPCMPGTQTCRAGTWSRCEGAVGPTADVCGDAIDNDCDGLTNEGCTCTSTPEECNDRIDNDCDGDVDEVTCAPLPDAGMSIDAGVDAATAVDAACSGALCDVAPRPIAPLSTSTVTSRRPALRWENPPGVTEARVELCADRACAAPIVALDGASSIRPTTELAPGWVFWRLRSRSGRTTGHVVSPTWQFWVGVRSATEDRDTSWGSAADLDGDGFSEATIGVYERSAVRRDGTLVARAGTAEIYRGGSTGLGPAPTWTLQDLRGGSGFGASITSIGDLNGDGFPELGVQNYPTKLETFVFYGSAAGPSNDRLTIIPSPAEPSFAGTMGFDGVGDLNGDGYGDAVIAHSSTIAAMHAGVAVYLGGPDGVPTAPTYRVAADEAFVYRVARAGDVNGDGFADFSVLSADRDYSARTSLYLGGTTRASLSRSVVNATSAVYPLESDDGCDVNGDGRADVLALAPSRRTPVVTGGSASVFFGTAAGMSATPNWTLSVPSAFSPGGASQDGARVLGCLGDINRDGYADLGFGSFEGSASGSPSMRLNIFYGSASGPAAMADLVLFGPPASRPSGSFGVMFAAHGDVDGDGHGDFFAGYHTNADFRGAASLYSGAEFGAAWAPRWTIEGAAAREFLGVTSLGRPLWR